jgi:hypothetical protein
MFRTIGRAGSEVGGGEGTAEESPPANRVADETDYFRIAGNSGVGGDKRVYEDPRYRPIANPR